MGTALGKSFSSEEESKVQYYIKLVSAFVASYTAVSFARVNGAVVRLQSDYYGRVHLPGGPVHDVTSVFYVNSSSSEPQWEWNGINEIYLLQPRYTIDVTYDYGYESIPDDVGLVATEAVKRMQANPDDNRVGPITEYTVGSVSERYNVFTGQLSMFNDMEKLILDDYRGIYYSEALGFSQEDPFFIPESDSALFE